MLNIWLLQIGEPLLIRGDERKMRSNLLAEELARRGHNIQLWVSAFDHNAKKWAIRSESELIRRDNIRVVVLKGTGYKKNVSLARFLDHRVLSWNFMRLAKEKEKPDIIIASSPPHDLAYQSVKYARRNRIPVIVDIRDPWPDIFLDNVPDWLKRTGKILFLRDFQMVKKTMGEAESIVAVSNAFLEWGLSHGKRKRSLNDQVFYLGYHRPDANIRQENVRKELRETLNALGNRTVVVYIGTFSGYHDPSVIVDCAKTLPTSDLAFILAGYGDFYDQVRVKAKSLPNVYFPGWLNRDEIDALLVRSSIGICPTPMKVDLFPNKAFMYISAGLPVVSSFQGDLKALIESERIGFYFDPGAADKLANAVVALSSNPHVYKEMSGNARRVFELKFGEDKIYQDFADHVERIASGRWT